MTSDCTKDSLVATDADNAGFTQNGTADSNRYSCQELQMNFSFLTFFFLFLLLLFFFA